MTEIIKDARIVDDAWQTLKLAEGDAAETVVLPTTPTLVPLAVWRTRRDDLLARKIPFGLWLDSHEGPEEIADDLKHFALIAVNFPKFADGRGYSTARLLRERYGYAGELRAIGDVLRDQLFLLRRCGFDAFALRADKDIRDALAGFEVFSERYQAAVDEPLPLFRRRAASEPSHG
ncbi:DUF934 domain-containing protein [uncultured Propionivibrio sp.]|uniref:DUF934 domain-containing protein n=1 Tax=uncultured Propionivibrio sp. TaxID=426737 RepID=UPI0029BFF404|nr:DUF934 domain-containing protein [uncultured Propionivibrio sp.]